MTDSRIVSPGVLRADILSALEEGASHFPMGRTGGPEVMPYAQYAGPSCFYASHIAIQATHSGRPPINEEELVSEAYRSNLIEESGAQTRQQFYEAQAQFLQERIGLEIEFVDPLYPVSVAHRLIRAVVEQDQVVFGLHARKHWVVLDGLKRTFGRPNLWTGMDPDGGKRIEYPAQILQESLAIAGMPMVVVRNPNVERPTGRFRPARQPASNQSRFKGRGVRPRFQPHRG